MSYIETSLALLLLSVIIAPMLMSVSIFRKSITQTRETYERMTYANNLLTEVVNVIEHRGADYIEAHLQNTAYETRFKTNQFSYEVRVASSNNQMTMQVDDKGVFGASGISIPRQTMYEVRVEAASGLEKGQSVGVARMKMKT